MSSSDEDWNAWLDEHGPSLVLFARQWAPTSADAEDVVQEAFVRFWRSRAVVRDPAAYVYTCVKRCALERLRRGKRRRRRETDSADGRQRDFETTLFVDDLETRERRATVENALQSLPPEQREVIVLKIWGELTFEQIGAALDVSAHTAASRYRYALAKMRGRLAEETLQ